jgi:hypothetical protein
MPAGFYAHADKIASFVAARQRASAIAFSVSSLDRHDLAPSDGSEEEPRMTACTHTTAALQ